VNLPFSSKFYTDLSAPFSKIWEGRKAVKTQTLCGLEEGNYKIDLTAVREGEERNWCCGLEERNYQIVVAAVIWKCSIIRITGPIGITRRNLLIYLLIVSANSPKDIRVVGS
jgi:hypothetical protein